MTEYERMKVIDEIFNIRRRRSAFNVSKYYLSLLPDSSLMHRLKEERKLYRRYRSYEVKAFTQMVGVS